MTQISAWFQLQELADRGAIARRVQGLEEDGMKAIRNVSILVVMTALLCAPGLATAQNSNSVKTIGTPSGAASTPVPSLIVVNARGATLAGQKLTLNGVSPNSIVFADRPVRAAGHALTKDLLDEWNAEGGTFAKDPPNATIAAFNKDGSSVRDAVVVLKSPKLEGDQLNFDVDVLEGGHGVDGPA